MEIFAFLKSEMNQIIDLNPPILWEPKEGNGKSMTELKQIIENKYRVHLDDYCAFHTWSIENPCEFWEETWDYMGIVYSQRFNKVIDMSVPMSSSKWFEGARLNYAENLLRYRNDKVALISAGEDREPVSVTYSQMYEESRLYAAALRKFGLKKGDTVVCFMSNRVEAFFFHNAVVSIGAIWSGALPLYGAQAAVSRFKQINPRVLVTVDRFCFEKQEIEMLPKIRSIAGEIPSLEKIIIVPSRPDSSSTEINNIRNSCFLDDFLRLGRDEDGSVPPMVFEQVSFSHPVVLSFTSGTTGTPKAVLHGCGILMGIYTGMVINSDSDSESVWISVSPPGWVSWTFFGTLLFTGCTIVLFEGNPYYLTPTYFWNFIDKFNITHLFLPSSVVDEFQKRNYIPTPEMKLSSVKVVIAAGSVLKPQNFDFMYSFLKDTLFAAGYSSTEAMGCGYFYTTTLPVRRGEIPAKGLGVPIDILDDNGKPVDGKSGEIVITNPLPALPVGLWGDIDGTLYLDKYFNKYIDKFLMGDYGIRNPNTKGYIIIGRSDDTLKQRGCRFGSSEIYRVVEDFPEVRDSICVSQYNKERDERAVLFLQIKESHSFNEELVQRIRAAISTELTVRHVPDVIIEIKEIPYNINGKKLESIVKKVINHLPITLENITAINPHCLKDFENLTELQDF